MQREGGGGEGGQEGRVGPGEGVGVVEAVASSPSEVCSRPFSCTVPVEGDMGVYFRRSERVCHFNRPVVKFRFLPASDNS